MLYRNAKHNEAHYLPCSITTVNNNALTARLNKVSSSPSGVTWLNNSKKTLPFVCRTFKSIASSHVSFILITCSPPSAGSQFLSYRSASSSFSSVFQILFLCFSVCAGSSSPLPSLNCAFTADCSLFLSLSRSSTRAGSSDRVTCHAPTAPFSPQWVLSC